MDYEGWDMRTPWTARGTQVLNADGDVAVAECRNAGESVVHATDRAKLVAEAVNAMVEKRGVEVRALRWTRASVGPGLLAWHGAAQVGHVTFPLCARADGHKWEARLSADRGGEAVGVATSEEGKALVQSKWAAFVVSALVGLLLVVVPWQALAFAGF